MLQRYWVPRWCRYFVPSNGKFKLSGGRRGRACWLTGHIPVVEAQPDLSRSGTAEPASGGSRADICQGRLKRGEGRPGEHDLSGAADCSPGWILRRAFESNDLPNAVMVPFRESPGIVHDLAEGKSQLDSLVLLREAFDLGDPDPARKLPCNIELNRRLGGRQRQDAAPLKEFRELVLSSSVAGECTLYGTRIALEQAYG